MTPFPAGQSLLRSRACDSFDGSALNVILGAKPGIRRT